MKLQHKYILLIAVIVGAGIALTVYGIRNRKKMQEEVDELYRLIRKGVGALGQDIKSLVDKIVPDTRNSQKLMAAADSIYSAFFWKDFLGYVHRNIDDDEDKVKNTLKNMSKAEVKGMLPLFASTYGEELDDFLRKYNTDDTLKTYYTTVVNLTK